MCCGEIEYERRGMRASWSSSGKQAWAVITWGPQGGVVTRCEGHWLAERTQLNSTVLTPLYHHSVARSAHRRYQRPCAGLTPGGNRTENRKEDRGTEARVAAGAETETHEDDWEATHSATIRKPILPLVRSGLTLLR